MLWPDSSQPANATAQQVFDPFHYGEGYNATFAAIDNANPITYQPTPVYASTGFQHANDSMSTETTMVSDNEPLWHDWIYLPGDAGTSIPSSNPNVPALFPSGSGTSDIDSRLSSSLPFPDTSNQLESCTYLSEAVETPRSSNSDELVYIPQPYIKFEDSMRFAFSFRPSCILLTESALLRLAKVLNYHCLTLTTWDWTEMTPLRMPANTHGTKPSLTLTVSTAAPTTVAPTSQRSSEVDTSKTQDTSQLG